MRIPKVYLETTIFNFIFADDAPNMRNAAIRLFDEIKKGKYEPFTSEYVTNELKRASNEKYVMMRQLYEDYKIKMLLASDEVVRLANIYVAEGIIPEKYMSDGLHIASATVADLDFIVSLNFKHIVKRKTIMLTEVVNAREGYKKVGIFSPMEVIDYDEA
jgi:hypothetical protein